MGMLRRYVNTVFLLLRVWLILISGILATIGSGGGTFEIGTGYTYPSLPAPNNLTATAESAGLIKLACEYDGPLQDTTGFYVYRNNVRIARIFGASTNISYSDSTVSGNTGYCYQVTAYNPSHESSRSNVACATTPPDTQPPTAPSNVAAVITSTDQVTLTWNASIDDVEVVAYRIYKDGQFLKSVQTTTSTDSIGIAEQHCYRVTAIDAVGNVSSESNSACVDSSWKTEVLISGAEIKNVSIAIDSNDHIHILYYNHTSGELTYMTNSSGTWLPEIIAYMGTQEYPDSSISVDSKDNVHVAYKDTINNYLMYANNITGNWEYEVIDDNGYATGRYNSIAIDSLDKVHISYYQISSLYYVTNKSGIWLKEEVDTFAYNYSSIAVDSNNYAYISYMDYISPDDLLTIVTNKTGTWINEAYHDTGNVHPSLVIDTTDHLHACYFRIYLGGKLGYATNASGSWEFNSLEPLVASAYCSISVDSANKVHISKESVYDSTYRHIELAYLTNQSGEWRSYIIDADSDGYLTAIGVDSQDYAHIVYIEEWPYFNLSYATNSP